MSLPYPYVINHFLKRSNNPEIADGYIVDENTGEVTGEGKVLYKSQKVELDAQQFIKTYMQFYTILRDLSVPAIKVLCYIGENIKRNHLSIKLNYEDVANYCEYKTIRPYYQGLNELIEKDIIRKKEKGEYWVNANVFFKGDRKKITKDFPNE